MSYKKLSKKKTWSKADVLGLGECRDLILTPNGKVLYDTLHPDRVVHYPSLKSVPFGEYEWPVYKRQKPFAHLTIHGALKCQFKKSFTPVHKIKSGKFFIAPDLMKKLKAAEFPYGLRVKFLYSPTYKLYRDVFKYGPKADGADACTVIMYRGNDGRLQYIPPSHDRKKKKPKKVVTSSPVWGSFIECARPCCRIICPARPRINVNFRGYDRNKKFRSCARRFDQPLLMELDHFNLIFEDLMTHRHLWTLFVDYRWDDDSFTLQGYYFGEFETFSIRGTRTNVMTTIKLFYREMKKYARVVRKKKRQFFGETLKRLKSAARVNGTMSRLYRRLLSYVHKLSVFGYGLSPDFISYLAVFLNKMKVRSWYSFNDEGEFLKLKTKHFFVRDFKQFVGNEALDPALINVENKRIVPTDDGLAHLSALYFDVTGWLWGNFNGFFLEAEDHVTIAGVGHQLSLFYHGNPLNMAQFRMIPSTLEHFQLKSFGGLVFNTTSLCRSGEAIRPAFGRMNPVRTLHMYNIQGSYGSSLKNAPSIPCGQFLHYAKTGDGIFERVKDAIPLNTERDITYNLIYSFMNHEAYDIASVYHSYNHLNQFTLNKYSLDLTLVLKSKADGALKVNMYLIDGVFWHGPCPLGCQDENFRYVNGRDGRELAEESSRKYREIKGLAEIIFGSRVTVERVFPCHFKTVDPFTGEIYHDAASFYKDCRHPLITPLRLYRNPKKRLRLDQDVYPDPHCFITARVTLPPNFSFGYCVGKFCLKCRNDSLSDCHHLRLVAANKSQQYSLFSNQQLRFLVEECGARIVDATHVWRYVPSRDYQPYIVKVSGLRAACQERGLVTLKKMCKNMINGGIGYFQMKSDRPRARNYLAYKKVPRRLASAVQSLTTVNGNGRYLKFQIPGRYPSGLNYYFGQSLLGVSHAVLQESKLILLKIFLALDRYMDPEKLKLLYVNTDSCLVACTEKNLSDCVRPSDRNHFFSSVYPDLFYDDDGPGGDSTGRLILEKSFQAPFEFTSSSSRNYQIITPGPAPSWVKGVKSVSLIQHDRLALDSLNLDSVPF